jgi:hypothetical protein
MGHLISLDYFRAVLASWGRWPFGLARGRVGHEMEVLEARWLLWCSSACGHGRARWVLVRPLGGCHLLGFG